MPNIAAEPELIAECFGMMYAALQQSQNRRFDDSRRMLALTLLSAAPLPDTFRDDVLNAWFYCTMLVQFRESPEWATPEKRAQAAQRLDGKNPSISSALFHELLYVVLMELGEFRRALPFAERRLTIAIEAKESTSITDRLWQMGRCYSQLGLRDHAAIAQRASARIFRNHPADPRFPVVLLALANTIRKTSPNEAEALYKEASTLWESKGQLESATPAWVNLAILCSDQERFQEALDYYERVRKIREASPRTSPARIGILYNNLAGCYRKMERFPEAHQAIEHALKILTGPGISGTEGISALASALGTKGMILRDQDRNSDALECFRRARATFEGQPSPNFENVIEELEHEVSVLNRLERTDEAAETETQIATLRAKLAEVPGFHPDSSADTDLTQGTVLIELDGGLRSESSHRDINKLGLRLSELLEENSLGRWQGCVHILESSTLIYYGPNAEAMYAALEADLRADARAEGARITIRQGTSQRELMHTRRMVN